MSLTAFANSKSHSKPVFTVINIPTNLLFLMQDTIRNITRYELCFLKLKGKKHVVINLTKVCKVC